MAASGRSAAAAPRAFDLNGKLLNLVFDGQAEYVKDSGTEKIAHRRRAGQDPEAVRRRAVGRPDQRAVHRGSEPGAEVEGQVLGPAGAGWSGSSSRTVRESDDASSQQMRSERMLGALLSLLIDNYVLRDEQGRDAGADDAGRVSCRWSTWRTTPWPCSSSCTSRRHEPLGAEAALVDETFDVLVQRFQSWRLKSNDIDRVGQGGRGQHVPTAAVHRAHVQPGPRG